MFVQLLLYIFCFCFCDVEFVNFVLSCLICWHGHVIDGHVSGCLFIVFLILVVTCAEITIVLCYFQLCSEV